MQIAKRCLIGVVLAIAATLPQFQFLQTSAEGLRLIADFEGCQLTPYKCAAGVWTSGIGHTSDVKPGKGINEHQAAENFVSDVLNVEHRLAECVPVKMPQSVYDSLVSLTFNVGTGAICKSTMVVFIKRQQWWKACHQLPRWIYIDGVKSQGLENRRGRELAWCIQGIAP